MTSSVISNDIQAYTVIKKGNQRSIPHPPEFSVLQLQTARDNCAIFGCLELQYTNYMVAQCRTNTAQLSYLGPKLDSQWRMSER